MQSLSIAEHRLSSRCARRFRLSISGDAIEQLPRRCHECFAPCSAADLKSSQYDQRYVDQGFESYFLRFMIRVSGIPDRSSGTPPTGAAGTGPITLSAYPNEVAFINGSATNNPSGTLSGLNGQNYPLAGKWIVIANLKIEGGGYDGPISQEIYGDYWRVINNELSATTGVTSGKQNRMRTYSDSP